MKIASGFLACTLIVSFGATAAPPKGAADAEIPLGHFRVKPRIVYSAPGMFVQEVTIETASSAKVHLSAGIIITSWTIEKSADSDLAQDRILIIVERLKAFKLPSRSRDGHAPPSPHPSDTKGDYTRTVLAYGHDGGGRYQSLGTNLRDDPGGHFHGGIKVEGVFPYCESDCIAEDTGVKLFWIGGGIEPPTDYSILLHVSE